jgi:predicted dehydrogenase
MQKLKVGIIGLGVGEQHIVGYGSNSACEVVALCDFDESKLDKAKKKYSRVRVTKEANDIIDDPKIDVVSIASYDSHHYKQIVRSLEAGKHVLVEKPMCVKVSEAKHIRCLLNKYPDLCLSSRFPCRLIPRFKRVKKMIENGTFGELFYLDGAYNYGRLHKIIDGWRGEDQGYSGVFGGGVHIGDLFLWLTGSRIVEVTALANNIVTAGTNLKSDDCVISVVKFENGMLGKVAVSLGCVSPHHHLLSVYGTEATFHNEHGGGQLFKKTKQGGLSSRKVIEAYPGRKGKGDFQASFIDHIRKKAQPLVTVDDVFDAMSVCFAIEKAINLGRSVKVEYL